MDVAERATCSSGSHMHVKMHGLVLMFFLLNILFLPSLSSADIFLSRLSHFQESRCFLPLCMHEAKDRNSRLM